MIGLDTNVLVRYLVQDDAKQARRATQKIEAATATGEMCFVGSIVLCELVWVLESAYGFDRQVVADVIDKILRTAQFAIEDKDTAWAALHSFRATKADFADCLIGKRHSAVGAKVTLTFDRQAAAMPEFALI